MGFENGGYLERWNDLWCSSAGRLCPVENRIFVGQDRYIIIQYNVMLRCPALWTDPSKWYLNSTWDEHIFSHLTQHHHLFSLTVQPRWPRLSTVARSEKSQDRKIQQLLPVESSEFRHRLNGHFFKNKVLSTKYQEITVNQHEIQVVQWDKMSE